MFSGQTCESCSFHFPFDYYCDFHLLFLLSFPTAPGPTCQRYNGTVCRHVGTIAIDYIYINTSIASQAAYEKSFETELEYLYRNTHQSPQCREAMTDLLCRVNFPLCDKSSSSPKNDQ